MGRLEEGEQPQDVSRAKAALESLRQRTEQRRYLVTQPTPVDTPAEVRQLVQELQVHQIELEMQYEELLLAQMEAEKSRAQYIDLYEFAPIGYCTIAANGQLQQLNLRASQLLGAPRQQLLGRRLALFVEMSSREPFVEFLQRLLSTGHRQTLTLPMRRVDNILFYARLEGMATSADLSELCCRLALFDVTEQYQAQQALTISEKRFRTLFELSEDGMLLLRDNRFVDCNDSVLRLLQLPDRKALLGQHASAFSPEKQPNGLRSYSLANQYWEETLLRGSLQFEWCRLRANGEPFWEEVLLTSIPEEVGSALVHASWRDITDRKLAEAERATQQQRLADAVLNAQEVEKRRIAESLHNGLGQSLYAAKLHLDHIQVGDDQVSQQVKAKIEHLLSSAIKQARTLSHQLVPTTLEDFGLEAAMRDICQICSSPALQLRCHVQTLPTSIPKNLQIAVYRMAQELTNNIVKHAQATQASLYLREEHGYLILQARDNGQGFDAQQPSFDGLGLSAIRDRVRLLNGTLNVDSKKEQGTDITVFLPLAPDRSATVPSIS
ncbi:PAS domain-containing sensor histidine kinase [Hymenobacter defluvii]|uniref:Oxygen sensor histidine kinase NreB n=1 Tax=Hymenobacter defluvii TaxID=2054411 RepID=A0ABS3TBJ0_9BACT|nr:PAS domain S-box protein [Hymenobacter defluvii]MBO3271016.1 PAS domain S-box protein [Hymenobacter defluvii]